MLGSGGPASVPSGKHWVALPWVLSLLSVQFPIHNLHPIRLPWALFFWLSPFVAILRPIQMKSHLLTQRYGGDNFRERNFGYSGFGSSLASNRNQVWTSLNICVPQNQEKLKCGPFSVLGLWRSLPHDHCNFHVCLQNAGIVRLKTVHGNMNYQKKKKLASVSGICCRSYWQI